MNLQVNIIFSLLISCIVSAFAQTENKYIREGNEYYKKHNFSAAEKSYSKSVEKNKESFEGLFNKGDALYKQKKYEEAAQVFESLTHKVKDKPKLAQSYHNLGNSLLENKKYEDCVKAYQQALKLNPKDEDTRYNLAYAKKKMEQQKNQDKNGKGKDNKNSEGNKDQQNQDNKDQKSNDKKEQQQNKEEKDKQEQQANNQPQKMNKEDAKRLLEAMNNQEKDVQDKLKKKKAVGVKVQIEKDW